MSEEELLRKEIAQLHAEIVELKQQVANHEKFNKILYADNCELARKCKEHMENAKQHYDNVQKLLRFELKQPEETKKRRPYIKTNDGRVIELD